jgi:hypothetical protein
MQPHYVRCTQQTDVAKHAVESISSGPRDRKVESAHLRPVAMLAIAGHLSKRMLERYSHIRMEAKRKALDAIATAEIDAGYLQKSLQSRDQIRRAFQ